MGPKTVGGITSNRLRAFSFQPLFTVGDGTVEKVRALGEIIQPRVEYQPNKMWKLC